MEMLIRHMDDNCTTEVSEIIDYLNLKTGRKFKPNTKLNCRSIKYILKTYTIEDFKTVIDNKVKDWTNSKMEKYLQPSTLFNPKHFDEYLNLFKKTVKAIVTTDTEVLELDDMEETLIDHYNSIPYEKYLATSHWIRFRKASILNANFSCKLCNSKDDLNVHHNNYDNRGCETFNDVIVLCRSCHSKFHDKNI